MEPKIKNVYCYHKTNGERAFIYSVNTPSLPEQYTYFILDTNENSKAYTKRINQTINLLQMSALSLTPIEYDSDDYYIFMSFLSEAMHFKQPEFSNTAPKKYQKIPHPIPVIDTTSTK